MKVSKCSAESQDGEVWSLTGPEARLLRSFLQDCRTVDIVCECSFYTAEQSAALYEIIFSLPEGKEFDGDAEAVLDARGLEVCHDCGATKNQGSDCECLDWTNDESRNFKSHTALTESEFRT